MVLGLAGAIVVGCGEEGAPSAATPASPPSSPAASASPALAPRAATTVPAATPVSSAGWRTYTDGRVGIEFRYPPACPPRLNGATFEVGPRILLDVAVIPAPTLDAYVDDLLRMKDWRVESRIRGTLGDAPTIRLEYRFGGTNRFGAALFVGRGSLVYAWQYTAGGGATECDSAEVFAAVIESFRLTEIVR